MDNLYIEHDGERVLLCDLGPQARSRFYLGWPYENIVSGVPPYMVPLPKLEHRPADVRAFCVAKRKEGLRLRKIGELLGVSRQRVDQILRT